MNKNRKSKAGVQPIKINRSVSMKKRLPRQTHLLSRPGKRKTSISKMTQSFTTLHSQNFSKTCTTKLRIKTKEPSDKEIGKQIDKVVDILKNQLSILEGSGENKENSWFNAVEKVEKDVLNKKVRLFLKTIQIGYCGLASKNIVFPERKESKLSLNINKIKRDQIPDYQDQFMSNVENFSPSWRQMLSKQPTRTNSKHIKN